MIRTRRHSDADKTDRSGWSKRQATLFLYISLTVLSQPVIFHGYDGEKLERSAQIERREGHVHSKEVEVHFIKTTYNNEDLLDNWLYRHFRDRADGGPYPAHLLLYRVAGAYPYSLEGS